jgi:pimeloyl-ACP methyl ester carboxylesterase
MGLAMRLIGPARDAAFEARLRDLKIPVLALFGTADRLIPPEMARLYRDTLPNCHITMVYDAAHAVDSDRPEAVFAIARDFLARREGFVVTKESGAIFP